MQFDVIFRINHYKLYESIVFLIFAPAATIPAPAAFIPPPPAMLVPIPSTIGPATGHIKVNAAPPNAKRSPPPPINPLTFA